MRKLGDQWIEIIDGERHMVKAVEGCNCYGCFLYDWNEGGTCLSMPIGSCDGNYVIKDLGILNEDGCLPNCWGEYPIIECHSEVVVLWYCRTYGNVRCITAGRATKQEAIDAWNRRI